jgi:hypothetical protein
MIFSVLHSKNKCSPVVYKFLRHYSANSQELATISGVILPNNPFLYDGVADGWGGFLRSGVIALRNVSTL